MKTNRNFKIDKQVKRFMATMLDPVKRHEFKRMMIDAKLSGQREVEKKKKRGNEAEVN